MTIPRCLALALIALALLINACSGPTAESVLLQAELEPGSGRVVRVVQQKNSCRVDLLPDEVELYSERARCQAPRAERLPHGERFLIVGAHDKRDTVWVVCNAADAPAFSELFDSAGVNPRVIKSKQQTMFVLDRSQIEAF